MSSKTFWCDYCMARFPISELGKDKKGWPIHAGIDPCHYPTGNTCIEPGTESIPIASESEAEEVYDKLPDVLKNRNRSSDFVE